MTLFEPTELDPPVRRFGGYLLRGGGVSVADDVCHPIPNRQTVMRAVADHIELGGWCDRLAWAELVGPLDTARTIRARRLEEVRQSGELWD